MPIYVWTVYIIDMYSLKYLFPASGRMRVWCVCVWRLRQALAF